MYSETAHAHYGRTVCYVCVWNRSSCNDAPITQTSPHVHGQPICNRLLSGLICKSRHGRSSRKERKVCITPSTGLRLEWLTSWNSSISGYQPTNQHTPPQHPRHSPPCSGSSVPLVSLYTPRLYSVIIFIITMATAFIGYVLPWGQIRFWGATVITNVFSVIQYPGTQLVEWLWGGFAVTNPKLNRFFHDTFSFTIYNHINSNITHNTSTRSTCRVGCVA